MPSITIRNLDAPTKARLRVRAAHHQHSMEEEARHILRAALATDDTAPSDLGSMIAARFARLGGLDLPTQPREAMREPPHWGTAPEPALPTQRGSRSQPTRSPGKSRAKPDSRPDSPPDTKPIKRAST